MPEEWKAIEGFDDYEVSNFGRIRSKDRIVIIERKDGAIRRKPYKSQIIVPYKDKDGYLMIILRKDGKRCRKKIHRLVLQAFTPGVQGKNLCNHIDGNKSNNNIVNLEWCDHTRNIIHALDNNLAMHGEKSQRAKLKDSQVLEIKQRLKNGEPSYLLARDFDVTPSNISCIKKGKSWKRLLLPANHTPSRIPAFGAPSSL